MSIVDALYFQIKKKKKDRVGVILFRSAHHLLKKINKPIGLLTPFFFPRLTPFIQGLCTVTQTWLFLSIYYFPTILVWKQEWVIWGSFQFRDLDKYAPVSDSRRPTLWDGIINIQLQAERNICIVSEMLERLGNTVLELWLGKLFSGIITPVKSPVLQCIVVGVGQISPFVPSAPVSIDSIDPRKLLHGPFQSTAILGQRQLLFFIPCRWVLPVLELHINTLSCVWFLSRSAEFLRFPPMLPASTAHFFYCEGVSVLLCAYTPRLLIPFSADGYWDDFPVLLFWIKMHWM